MTDQPSPDQTGIDWEIDWEALRDAGYEALTKAQRTAMRPDVAYDHAVIEDLRRQQAAAGVVEVRREIVSLFGQYALAQALIEALLNDDERDPLSSDVGEEINAAVKGLHEITEQLEALSPELFVLAAAQEQQES